MLCFICLFTLCASCTLLYVCVKRLFVTISCNNTVIRVPAVDAIGFLHYCMWSRLIVNSFEVCLTKALLTALLSQIVFAYGLLTACFAWHNISIYITCPLFWVNELCAQPNLSLQDLLHASLELPKGPLATVSLLLVPAHDPHQALPACGCDLVGSECNMWQEFTSFCIVFKLYTFQRLIRTFKSAVCKSISNGDQQFGTKLDDQC
jgi:hypothetical protein